VASEYFINSQELENKVRNLLPSQGGAGAGFDLSASTQIIPIIDLTESAEGSNVREDLQKALSFKSCTAYSVSNGNSDVIVNTGTFRIFGNAYIKDSNNNAGTISLVDSAGTSKIMYKANAFTSSPSTPLNLFYDFLVKLEAGEKVNIATNATTCLFTGVTRQIADLEGNLTSP
jgi:hypothetical protein